MSRYRLTIRLQRSGTSFCIGADDDAEAVGKAIRIVSFLDAGEADVDLICTQPRHPVPLPALTTVVSGPAA